MIKKYLLIISLLFLSTIISKAQINITNTAFDTNGPMGQCLFPQNENNEITYTGVVHCDVSSDTIRGLLEEWIYDLKNKSQYNIHNVFFGLTKICFKVEILVGSELFNVGSIVSFARHKSKVTFQCEINIRDGVYQYKLYDFYTNRRIIRGEVKSEGQSNIIHWQRLNSLQKEKKKILSQRKVDKDELAECESLIKSEKQSYQAEYSSVMNFLKTLNKKEFIISDF